MDATRYGIVLVLASTVFLSGSDVTSKLLSASLPALEIAWLRYASFMLIMLGAAAWSHRRGVLDTRRPWLQILRGVGMVGSAALFIASLQYLPVADATAISFVSPLLVTALAVFFLDERVGWRRWAAAIAGFCGVLIIIRPGSDAFQWASLLPVLSALSWASALVITRRLATTDTSDTTMTYSALVGLVVLTVLVPWWWRTPTSWELLLGGLVGVLSTTGHWIIAAAYRKTDASILAPFSYSQILWATGISFLLFGSAPDAWTWTGVLVLILSGSYTAHRQSVRAQATTSVRQAG